MVTIRFAKTNLRYAMTKTIKWRRKHKIHLFITFLTTNGNNSVCKDQPTLCAALIPCCAYKRKDNNSFLCFLWPLSFCWPLLLRDTNGKDKNLLYPLKVRANKKIRATKNIFLVSLVFICKTRDTRSDTCFAQQGILAAFIWILKKKNF